jgi:hypothetical protein
MVVFFCVAEKTNAFGRVRSRVASAMLTGEDARRSIEQRRSARAIERELLAGRRFPLC